MAQRENQESIPFTLLSSPTPPRSNPPSVLDLFPVPARTEGDDDGHLIKKQLTVSDVNRRQSRLLLVKEDMKRVLPLMDKEMSAACQSREGRGLRVKMWDLDTLSEHELTLKQWEPRSFVLTSNWSKEFVRRRNLQKGDYIGLRWDTQNLRFLFQKFNAQ